LLAFQRFNAKNFQKEVLYLELLTLSRVAIHQVVLALTKVKELSECSDIKLKWQAEVEHYRDLLLKVINQTEWRVINKEKIIFQKKLSVPLKNIWILLLKVIVKLCTGIKLI